MDVRCRHIPTLLSKYLTSLLVPPIQVPPTFTTARSIPLELNRSDVFDTAKWGALCSDDTKYAAAQLPDPMS